jgi:hypothetical protein
MSTSMLRTPCLSVINRNLFLSKRQVHQSRLFLKNTVWRMSYGSASTIVMRVLQIRGCWLLGPFKSGALYYNHMPACEILQHVGDDVWNAYFKFTIVRNPFDKLVFAFYHFEKFRNPDKYLNEDKNDIKKFIKWVLSGKKVDDKHLYLIEGQEAIGYYICFESLKEGFRFVCASMGVKFVINALPNFKRGFRNTHYALAFFYDQESADLVAQNYEFEINKFGYPCRK